MIRNTIWLSMSTYCMSTFSLKFLFRIGAVLCKVMLRFILSRYIMGIILLLCQPSHAYMIQFNTSRMYLSRITISLKIVVFTKIDLIENMYKICILFQKLFLFYNLTITSNHRSVFCILNLFFIIKGFYNYKCSNCFVIILL